MTTAGTGNGQIPLMLIHGAERYERSPAKTDFLEFAGRPHLHMVAPDWQEVAEAIHSWLDGALGAPVPGTLPTTP